MNDIHTAEGIRTWTSMGIKLPAELVKALELFEAVRYIEVEHRPRVDLDAITAKNAEAKIKALAEEYLFSTQPHGGGHTPLTKAKKEIVDAATGRVINLAKKSIPELIDQLSPEFDAHAAAYTEAVELLPNNLSVGALLDGGSEAGSAAIEAFQIAKDEAAHLGRFADWLAATSQLIPPYDYEPVLSVLRPTDLGQLQTLDRAAEREPAEDAVRKINPVFYAAARNGVDFVLNRPEQAKSIRRRLENSVAV